MTAAGTCAGSGVEAGPGEGGGLLDVRNLVVEYAGRLRGRLRAVAGVDLHVAAGSVVAVVGESGCGKTSLVRGIVRLVEPAGGTVRFAGLDWLALRGNVLRRWRRRMQAVFQDVAGALNPRMTVERIVCEPLAVHGLAAGEARRERVRQVLEAVGLSGEMAERYPHELSGGQRQRVVIARALAADPWLLLCDEPVSALDAVLRVQILRMLDGLRQSRGLGLVVVSHDLGSVAWFADEIAVMYAGRVVESGKREQIVGSARHPYTRALLRAAGGPVQPGATMAAVGPVRPDLPVAGPQGCAYFPRCEYATALCAQQRPVLRWHEGCAEGHRVACHRAEEIPVAGETLPAERPDRPADA